MTASGESLHSRLVATAAAYRHLHDEHRRARHGGHTRRHLEARLEKLAADFERLLAAPELDAARREQWRRHLHHGGARPEPPAAEPSRSPAARRPPRNRGRGSAPLWQR